ncbi:MAG: hypothetical protein ABIE94_01725 [archaeon]
MRREILCPAEFEAKLPPLILSGDLMEFRKFFREHDEGWCCPEDNYFNRVFPSIDALCEYLKEQDDKRCREHNEHLSPRLKVYHIVWPEEPDCYADRIFWTKGSYDPSKWEELTDKVDELSYWDARTLL